MPEPYHVRTAHRGAPRRHGRVCARPRAPRRMYATYRPRSGL